MYPQNSRLQPVFPLKSQDFSKIVPKNPKSVCLSSSVTQCDLGLALGWCRSRCQLQRLEKGLWQDQHQGHCVARRGLETSRGHPGKKVRPSDLPWRGPLRYAWPTNNLRSKQGNHLPGALTKSNWGSTRIDKLWDLVRSSTQRVSPRSWYLRVFLSLRNDMLLRYPSGPYGLDNLSFPNWWSQELEGPLVW